MSFYFDRLFPVSFSILLPVIVFVAGCGRQSPQSLVRRGEAALAGGDAGEAAQAFEQAVKRIADSPDLYYNLGNAYERLGNLEPAAQAFNTALQLNPTHQEALEGRALVAMHRQEWKIAQEHFARALRAADDGTVRARVLTAWGLMDANRADYDLARARFLAARLADPRYAPAFYNLASLYRDRLDLHEESLDLFQMYTRLVTDETPNLKKALNAIQRLTANQQRRRADETPEHRDPAKAAVLIQTGRHLEDARQSAKAIKAYREALAADGTAFAAARGLTRVYLATGARSEALEAARTAIRINPSHVEAAMQAAELAYQIKDYAEAGRIAGRLIARLTSYAPAYELMTRIRYAENHLPEARAYGELYVAAAKPGPDRDRYAAWLETIPSVR